MRNFLYIIVAVVVAVLANSVSAIWARQDSRFSIWFLLVILISPIVFITYGLATSRVGMAIASSLVDSLLIVGSVAVGLFFFKESDKILVPQYIGMILTFFGVLLVLFSPHFTK